jgi:hypothetical protein
LKIDFFELQLYFEGKPEYFKTDRLLPTKNKDLIVDYIETYQKEIKLKYANYFNSYVLKD